MYNIINYIKYIIFNINNRLDSNKEAEFVF